MLVRALFLSGIGALVPAAWGCDLCAIYNANSTASKSDRDLSIALSEQFIPYGTVQRDGRELPPSIYDEAFLDRSTTHIVPTWNFSQRFGISLNLPVVYERFKLFQRTGTGIVNESGEDTGIGDLALVGRCTVWSASQGTATVSVNLLAGVKFPTGDPSWLEKEVASTRELDAIYGLGHQHAFGGVHFSDLTLGSGSYDGVFGVTVNSRWSRLFCNGQFQYYLRTPGVPGYEFGDEWIISGGPGLYLLLNESCTFSLQCLVTYDSMDSDVLLGRENPNSGSTAIYAGPQFNLTIGKHFGANGGVDLPITIDNNGLQNVPDYRIHAGVSFRF